MTFDHTPDYDRYDDTHLSPADYCDYSDDVTEIVEALPSLDDDLDEELELDADSDEFAARIEAVMDAPEPKALMATGFVMTQKEDPFAEYAEFFSAEPKYETVQEPEIIVKTGWFSRLSQKVGNIVESFGDFLDKALHPSIAALLATALGTTAPTVMSTTNYAEPQGAQETVVISRMTPVEEAPSTKPIEPVPAPQTLADYLYSTAAYQHLLKELSKPGRGFSAVLTHPETQKAENIAQLINLVETHFGEKAADLVESNAAAMRLSASQIQELR